jgi:hypothetical protein
MIRLTSSTPASSSPTRDSPDPDARFSSRSKWREEKPAADCAAKVDGMGEYWDRRLKRDDIGLGI